MLFAMITSEFFCVGVLTILFFTGLSVSVCGRRKRHVARLLSRRNRLTTTVNCIDYGGIEISVLSPTLQSFRNLCHEKCCREGVEPVDGRQQATIRRTGCRRAQDTRYNSFDSQGHGSDDTETIATRTGVDVCSTAATAAFSFDKNANWHWHCKVLLDMETL